ncbi:cytochrome P450 [Haloarculaceae archaeon H-GB11]|nr:cytochrome P450 [Haloarculaceae archaeon H-GB11]
MKSTPPTPDGLPVLGHTHEYVRDAFDFIDRAAEAEGDAFTVRVLGSGEITVLAHPDYFEQALVAEPDAFRKSDDFDLAFGEGLASVEGEQWQRQREAMEEFFYPGRIRSYVDEMASVTATRLDGWDDGETVSLLTQAKALTLENLMATLFDRPLDPDGDAELRQAVADLNLWFKPTSWVLPDAVPTPSRRRFDRAVETIQSEARRMLDEREAEGTGDDLLSTLVEQRREGAGGLSDAEIVDQVGTLLFAGHDTTALALTYGLHALSRHPDVRDRFHAELDAVLGEERPTLGDLPDLDVTERILTEALRLYPPVHTIPRTTTRPVTVGDYRVPEGRLCHLSIYRMHRDPRFYDDPGPSVPSDGASSRHSRSVTPTRRSARDRGRASDDGSRCWRRPSSSRWSASGTNWSRAILSTSPRR